MSSIALSINNSKDIKDALWDLTPLFAFVLGALNYFDIHLILSTASNGTLIAMGTLFIFSYQPRYWILSIVPIHSIISTNVSTSIGALCVGVGSLLWLKGYRLLSGFISTSLLLLAGFFIGFKNLFNPYGRFNAWKIFFEDWFISPWWIKAFGFGPGSFEVISQHIQVREKLGVDAHGATFYYNMHSDLLQYVWEYGACGAALIALFAFCTLKRLHSKPIIFSAFLAGISSMSFNFPVRSAPICIFMMLLVIVGGNRKMRYN